MSTSLDRALRHFVFLNRIELVVGDTEAHFWGHGQLEYALRKHPDGSLTALIGPPIAGERVDWQEADSGLKRAGRQRTTILPWEGRAVLLEIGPHGKHWTMWNDWCGSIPVFHAQVGEGRTASTLEPVVVAAAGYTPDDFWLPGLVSLLINGHFLGDWTLYKDMKVVPPDCVAEWDDDGFRWTRLWTVKPSDERWDRGWGELVDEMHELSRRAIADVLKEQPAWILPLSGGLDSRLIAAVGAEMGRELHAYTYGPPGRDETVYACQVAKTLKVPWQRVDLGTDFVAKYGQVWADWFGSSMHFHGTYQFPFLQSLNTAPPGPIAQGFLGEALTGLHLPGLISAHQDQHRRGALTDGWIRYSVDELKTLLRVPVDQAVEAVAQEMESQINGTPGAWFQRLMFLDLLNRQRLFICYQPTMYDYWRGVATPFCNREYARFCLSLPVLALEDRRLQKKMFRQHYPDLAMIPGTYGGLPLVLSRRYLLKRGLAELLPRPLRRGPLREFDPSPDTMRRDGMRAGGRTALWPIHEAWEALAEWLDVSQVTATCDAALGGDMRAIARLEGVRTLAYRLLGNQT